MNNLQSEIWRKYGLSILRWLIVSIGLRMVEKGIIDKPTLDSITSPDVILAVGGVLAVVVTGIWQWWRTKYAVTLPIVALQADPATPMSVVKNETKNQI